MQSFRQYRKYREALERQIDRDRQKTGGPDQDSTLQQQNSQQHSSDKDVEKGQKDDSLSSTESQRTVVENRPHNQIHDPGSEQSLATTQDQRNAHPTEEVEEPEEAGKGKQEAGGLSLFPTRRDSSSNDLTTMGTQLGTAMTGVQVRKRNTEEGGDGNVFIVGFEGEDDPQNPHNWSITSRVGITIILAAIAFVVGVASSIDSPATKKAAAEFGVGQVAEICATGLYLIGFGAGALFAGPISETLGRNPVYIITMILYMIFIMASGLAPNLGAQLAFRFLAGFFGSTPLTCAGGSLSDIWSPIERTTAFPVFANAAFLGPILGPVMGGFIAQSNSVTWRWVEWTTLLMSGLVFGIVVLFLPETFPPILLKWKATHLRKMTGDDRYRAEVEIKREPFTRRLGRALYRPFVLTATEPIIILVALYMTVIYIILFTFLDGYDFIFGEIHGFSPGIEGLCFLGIAIGLFLASPLVFVVRKMQKSRLAHLERKQDAEMREGKLQREPPPPPPQLQPEFRLWFAMFGAPAIPISMFWMGWTSEPSISPWSPLAASVVFGFGILCVFISCYQYIIDSYEIHAASALASITLIRYVAAGAMTVVGIPFYENLGVAYTCTVLACLAAACTPVPYLFYWYGRRLRRRSKYSPGRD